MKWQELLRDARIEDGLTQGQVADRVGLTRTSVTNVEAGRQTPPLRKLRTWVRYLGWPSLGEFFKEAGL